MAAIHKSCKHQIEASFERQVSRLKESGYPDDLLVGVCETMCKRIKRMSSRSKDKTEANKTQNNIVVIPYIHGITHKLKKDCKTPKHRRGMLCRPVNNREKKLKKACNIAHRTRYAKCETAVVYRIPLSCGKCYIGQTGWCINDRAKRTCSGSEVHISRPTCQPTVGHVNVTQPLPA